MTASRDKDRDLRHEIGANGRMLDPALPQKPEHLRGDERASMRIERDSVRVIRKR